MQAPQLRESSGLVASHCHQGVFWSHNDSGDRARLFALDRDGRLIAEVEVRGAANRDWEAIATDDACRLYVGDIGNNGNSRSTLTIYVVPEPDPRSTATAEVLRKISLRFPASTPAGGRRRHNRDAEGLFFSRGDLFLLSKHRADTRTTLYLIPTGSSTEDEEVEMVDLGSFDLGVQRQPPAERHTLWLRIRAGMGFVGMATGADADDAEGTLALLSYHAIFLFRPPPGDRHYLDHPLGRIDLDESVFQQCEAIAWDGPDLVVTNEQGDWIRLLDSRKQLSPMDPPPAGGSEHG